MTVYTTNNKQLAAECKLLFSLNANCIQLRWSNNHDILSKSIIDSLIELEEFSNIILDQKTTLLKEIISFDENEENDMLCIIKSSPLLRLSIGSGVVFAGEMSNMVFTELEEKIDNTNSVKQIILDTLMSGDHLIII